MALTMTTRSEANHAGRWRFTVEQFHQLLEAEPWADDRRLELIRGDIYVMSQVGGPHVKSTIYLTNFLQRQLGDRALLSVQSALPLDDDTEVFPDIAVVDPGVLDEDGPLRPADVSLIVEVAQTSIRHDRVRKLPLYAGAGIPEYWVAVLPRRQLEVYRDPDVHQSRYRQVTILGSGDTVSPERWPDIRLDVTDIVRANRPGSSGRSEPPRRPDLPNRPR